MIIESENPNALLDFFRFVGVPMFLTRRNNSKMQTSKVWSSYMRRYNCSDKLIEPYSPQQNPTERHIDFPKNTMKRIFADIGCDPVYGSYYAFLCIIPPILKWFLKLV